MVSFLNWPKFLRASLILLVFLLLASFLLHNATAINQDLGRHLKTGQLIWQAKHVPNTNLFSYSEPDHLFLDHHWLSQVIFYGIYNFSGFNGLIIFTAFIILLSFGLVFSLAYKKKYFVLSILFSMVSIGLLAERTEIRPEIFGLLGISLFLFILERSKEKIRPSLFVLPLIQLFWVNLHISFCFGLAIFLFFFLDRFWARRKQLFKGKKPDGYLLRLLIIGIFLGLACLINPSGWRGALYPLAIFGNFGYSIAENQSPFYLDGIMHDPSIFVFKLALGAVLLGFLLNFRRLNLFYFLNCLLFFGLSWMAIRNFCNLGLVILPVLTLNFSQARENIDWLSYWEGAKIRPFLRLLTIAAIFVILIEGIYLVVSNQLYLKRGKDSRFGLGVPQGAAAAVDFLKTSGISGRGFNNFDIGGYLIWRLYPDKKVFVDGRPEAYSEDFFQKIYIPMQKDHGVWKATAEEYKFNYVFFAHTEGTPWGREFLYQISHDNDWSQIYLDSTVAIWIKNLPENKEIIDKYALTQEKLQEKADEYLSFDYQSILQMGSYFEATGNRNMALPLYEKAFSVYPKKELAMAVANIYTQKGQYDKALEYLTGAIRIEAEYADAHVLIGQIKYQQGDFFEAQQSWEKALEYDPENEKAKQYLDNMGLIPFKK